MWHYNWYPRIQQLRSSNSNQCTYEIVRPNSICQKCNHMKVSRTRLSRLGLSHHWVRSSRMWQAPIPAIYIFFLFFHVPSLIPSKSPSLSNLKQISAASHDFRFISWMFHSTPIKIKSQNPKISSLSLLPYILEDTWHYPMEPLIRNLFLLLSLPYPPIPFFFFIFLTCLSRDSTPKPIFNFFSSPFPPPSSAPIPPRPTHLILQKG